MNDNCSKSGRELDNYEVHRFFEALEADPSTPEPIREEVQRMRLNNTMQAIIGGEVKGVTGGE